MARGCIVSCAAGTPTKVAEHWRLEGEAAVFQRRHSAEPVVPPREVVFYTSCEECTPVLIRCDRLHAWRNLVEERQLWVEFRATFGPGETRRIERTSGTRDDLVAELRDDGLRVLRDSNHWPSRTPRSVRHARRRRVEVAAKASAAAEAATSARACKR